jgi:hypothetical protein
MHQGSRPAESARFGYDRQRPSAFRYAQRDARLYLTGKAQADSAQGAQYTAGRIAPGGHQTAEARRKRRHEATERHA